MTDGVNGHPRDGLSAYLDDQLGVEERAAMDRHLADCEDCRDELEALWLLAKAVGKEEAPPVPAGLAGRIIRSLDAATVVRFPRRRFLVPATIAATIGAIGILVALQWREGYFVAPAVPEPKEQDRVFGAPTRSNAPPAPVATEDTLKERQTRPEQESTGLASQDKDVNLADTPVVEELSKQKKDERVGGGVEGGVPRGVVGGNESGGSVEPADVERRDREESKVMNEVVGVAPAPAAKSAVLSSCADRWSDSGVRGSWGVPDIYEAERQFGRIAHAVGGIGLWRGVADGRPYVVVVPRNHFEEVFYALRARGVTGLDEPPAVAEGTDCVGISVALKLAAEPASPAPR
jgi:hypothetical protein